MLDIGGSPIRLSLTHQSASDFSTIATGRQSDLEPNPENWFGARTAVKRKDEVGLHTGVAVFQCPTRLAHGFVPSRMLISSSSSSSSSSRVGRRWEVKREKKLSGVEDQIAWAG
jgi:hypothetical protein